MKSYIIGIVGPVSGLSAHQYEEIAAAIREVKQVAETVTLQIWRDTSNRHPVGSDHEDKMHGALAEIGRRTKTGLAFAWVEFAPSDAVKSREQMQHCDSLLFCPAEHARTAKSRVNTLRRIAEENHVRFRIAYPWRAETTR